MCHVLFALSLSVYCRPSYVTLICHMSPVFPRNVTCTHACHRMSLGLVGCAVSTPCGDIFQFPEHPTAMANFDASHFEDDIIYVTSAPSSPEPTPQEDDDFVEDPFRRFVPVLLVGSPDEVRRAITEIMCVLSIDVPSAMLILKDSGAFDCMILAFHQSDERMPRRELISLMVAAVRHARLDWPELAILYDTLLPQLAHIDEATVPRLVLLSELLALYPEEIHCVRGPACREHHCKAHISLRAVEASWQEDWAAEVVMKLCRTDCPGVIGDLQASEPALRSLFRALGRAAGLDRLPYLRTICGILATTELPSFLRDEEIREIVRTAFVDVALKCGDWVFETFDQLLGLC